MDRYSLLPRKSHHASEKCLRYALFTHDWSTVWTIIVMFLALIVNCVAFSVVIALNNTRKDKRKSNSRSDGNEPGEEAEQTELDAPPSNGPYQLVNDSSAFAKTSSHAHPFRPTWLPRSIPLPNPRLKPRRISHSRQRAAVPRFVQSTLLSLIAYILFFISILTLFRVALCHPKHTHKLQRPVILALVFFVVVAIPQIVLGVIAGCHWLGLLAKVYGWKVKTTGIFKVGMMVFFSPVLLVYILGTWAVANCQNKYCLQGGIDDEEEEQELGRRSEEEEDGDVDGLGAFIDEDAGEIVFNGDEEEEEDEEEDRPPSYEGVMAGSSNGAASAVNQGRNETKL